jgi:Antp family protein
MQQQQQPLTPSGYNSCKLQNSGSLSPVGVGKWEPVGPPLSPSEMVGLGNGSGGNGMTPNGNQQNQHGMGMYGQPGQHPHVGNMPPHQQHQHPHGGMGGVNGNGNLVQHQPPPPHHPNQNIQNPHQSPQQQNSPAAALPSPLYPWMRSQFGK